MIGYQKGQNLHKYKVLYKKEEVIVYTYLNPPVCTYLNVVKVNNCHKYSVYDHHKLCLSIAYSSEFSKLFCSRTTASCDWLINRMFAVVREHKCLLNAWQILHTFNGCQSKRPQSKTAPVQNGPTFGKNGPKRKKKFIVKSRCDS